MRVMWLCPNCGSLHQREEDGTNCCRAEEIFLCGRGTKSNPRFHFEEEEAKKCKKQKTRIEGCYQR